MKKGVSVKTLRELFDKVTEVTREHYFLALQKTPSHACDENSIENYISPDDFTAISSVYLQATMWGILTTLGDEFCENEKLVETIREMGEKIIFLLALQMASDSEIQLH